MWTAKPDHSFQNLKSFHRKIFSLKFDPLRKLLENSSKDLVNGLKTLSHFSGSNTISDLRFEMIQKFL